MPDTVICAYCSSVIPASAKTCPMCGADNQPDYYDKPEPVVQVEPLRPFVEPLPLVEETPPQPFTAQPYSAAPLPRVPAAPPASSNTNRYILIGVIALVLVCLCIGAVVLAGLRGILGY